MRASSMLPEIPESVDKEGAPVTLDSLASAHRWVTWRHDERAGKRTKVPYSPNGGGKARADDPTTWGTRREAERRAARLAGAEGVGLELGDLGNGWALGGIDLDTCREAKTGALESWAEQTIRDFDSYAEVSPSATGVKVFFRYPAASLPALRKAMGTDHGKAWKRGKGEHPPAIELHLGNRYFAVTGDRLHDAPVALRTVTQAQLLTLIEIGGPAFAAGKAASRGKADEWAAGAGKGDKSRSGRAFALAGKIRRRGGSKDDYLSALESDPELAEWAEDGRQVSRAWAKTAPDLADDLDGFALNEDGVARAFAAKFRDRLRYCHHAGRWYEWTGAAWRVEETNLAFHWARTTCRDLAQSGLLETGSAALSKAAAASAVERFARADRVFAVISEVWDRDPWLLGTPGGTVDLRTGAVQPARQSDHITKLATVAPESSPADFDPDLECPRWLDFLRDTTGDDPGLIRFLQQWCGYTLTGDTREHAVLFIYGPGGNGKSVFLNTVAGILGDYGRTAAMDTFMSAKGDRHSTDLAMLRGARMVTASETEEGRAWAESRIKELTGGSPISARFMRQDNFTFLPAFKLTITGNHKPVLQNVDDAARRRFNIVPFDRKPATPDRELESKLKKEWPAILSWMIAGCLDWQRNGLIRPQVVMATTAEYFAEQDTFQQWIDDCCETGAAHACTVSALWASYSGFANARGEPTRSRTKGFPDALRSRGFEKGKDKWGLRGHGFRGIRLCPQTDPLEGEGGL